MTVLILFAAVALLLAAVGLYGVLSYSVRQRTREIGIRRALGAGTDRLVGGVVRDALVLAGIGTAVGIVGALGLTRVIESLLYEISPTDPVTLLAVAALLPAIALLAAYVPARRAAHVDPMVALRQE
jgi:ABC-type antimicrobial peptide transport system permease subunit